MVKFEVFLDVLPTKVQKVGRSATSRGAAAPPTDSPPKASLARNGRLHYNGFKPMVTTSTKTGVSPDVPHMGPAAGLWKYTLLDTSSPVKTMCSQCQTDQSS